MVPDPALLEHMADSNLCNMLREQARFSAGAELHELDDAVIALGTTSFPAAPFNAVIRTQATSGGAARLLDRVERRFRERGRRFSVYVRAGRDDDLGRECRARDYVQSGKLKTMVLAHPAVEAPGAEVEQIEDLAGVERFVTVAAESFASVALPRAVTRSALSAREQLLGPAVRLVVGGGQASALSIGDACTEGIYWVGTVPAARGRGLASACVSALAHSAFARGAGCVVVQAAHNLEGFYRALGFTAISQLDLYTNLNISARIE